eukprot:2053968-Rhodomonas_salina.2
MSDSPKRYPSTPNGTAVHPTSVPCDQYRRAGLRDPGHLASKELLLPDLNYVGVGGGGAVDDADLGQREVQKWPVWVVRGRALQYSSFSTRHEMARTTIPIAVLSIVQRGLSVLAAPLARLGS